MVFASGCTSLPGDQLPGDELLKLAGPQLEVADLSRVHDRAVALMDHLQVADETRAGVRDLINPAPTSLRRDHGFASILPRTRVVRLEKSQTLVTRTEAADVVIVGRHDVVVAYARDAVVIAGGNVKISHASNVFVVAGGSIEVSHDGRTQPGFYVARGEVRLAHSNRPTLYAAGGVSLSHFATAVTYNTDFRAGYVGMVRHVRPPIFEGEVERRPGAPSMLVATGGSDFAYTGERCAGGISEEGVKKNVVGAARKRTPCGTLDFARVRCVARSADESDEHWTIGLCGKVQEFVVRRFPNSTYSIRNAADPEPRSWKP